VPATRHLSRALAEAALRGGRGIEQLLSVDVEGTGIRRVRWVAISSSRRGEFTLTAHNVRDEGSSSIFDVHEFAPADDEEPIGEGRLVNTFAEAEMAISAAEALGAVPARWVNQGLIGDEYRDATG
jgi:hypothetical protein